MAQPHKRQDPLHPGNGIYTTLVTETIPTPTHYRTQQTNPSYYNNPNPADDNNNDKWNGTKFVASIIPIAIIAAIVFGIWYCCCGGRAKHQQRRAARNLPQPHVTPNAQLHPDFQTRAVELTPVPAAHLGDAPPPRYEEAVPPRHQTIAGGVTHLREEDEGIISDGKTPLSEIPFEDVVVSSASSMGSGSGSGSSARNFGQAHHGSGGNTYGHTNS